MVKLLKPALGMALSATALGVLFPALGKATAWVLGLPYAYHFGWSTVLPPFAWLLFDRWYRRRQTVLNRDQSLGRAFVGLLLPLLLVGWFILGAQQRWLYLQHQYQEVFLLSVFWMEALLWGLLIAIHVGVQLGLELLRKWRLSLAEAERYQKQHTEARLEVLKTQINPHFLFNSLNTLSGLIHEDPNTAVRFLNNVSNVYRGILDARSRDLISLSEELEMIQDYIALVQTRFKGSIFIDLQIPAQAHSLHMVPLSLQMLIENAIKHNRASLADPLHIEIRFVEPDQISVRNELRPKTTLEPSTKVGLANIRDRCVHLTGRSPEVLHKDGYFEVLLPLLNRTR
ncbi:hypothetical protein GC167_05890 [bacterium]|nr:hypothetical protein [bacterium]